MRLTGEPAGLSRRAYRRPVNRIDNTMRPPPRDSLPGTDDGGKLANNRDRQTMYPVTAVGHYN